MNARLILLKRWFHDLKYNPAVNAAYALACRIQDLWPRRDPDGIVRRLALLARYSYGRKPERILALARALDSSRYDSPNYGEYAEKEVLYRSIVLKDPVRSGDQLAEKGVLLVTFTHCFEYFLRELDTARLLEDYYVVLEPSWSGYCDPRILEWTRYPDRKVIVQATEREDFEFIRGLRSNLVPVEFGASDWVDDRLFRPGDGKKEYDAVYVAVYGAYKRHQVLFKALAGLRQLSLRTALVGVPWMGKRAEIEALIRHYGLEGYVDLYENLPPARLNEILGQAKVNVLLSRREGSNRSIFEGFFADVPGIVLKRNKGVQKKSINESTGMLVDEKDLPGALVHFQEKWRTYRPREWAEANISPARTTAKLNELLKELAAAEGLSWETPAVRKVNAPEVRYYDEDEGRDLTPISELVARYRR